MVCYGIFWSGQYRYFSIMDCSLGTIYYYYFSQQEPKLSCVTFFIKGFYLSTYLLTDLLTVGSSRHRHSHKQTALVTASFTKLGLLNSDTNSVFLTFPLVACSSSYGILFHVPRVSAYENFHFTYLCHSYLQTD